MKADLSLSGQGLDNKAVWSVLEQALAALWKAYEDHVRTSTDCGQSLPIDTRMNDSRVTLWTYYSQHSCWQRWS